MNELEQKINDLFKDRYYLSISDFELIKLFISKCSLSDFEKLKDLEYDLSINQPQKTIK